MFRLEHARPHAVADVVHELNKALAVAVDARLNAVIVRDPTGERYMGVVERVISELDRPSEPEGSAVTEFVRLEHRDAEDVVRVLSRSIGRIGLQMGHDSANQLVLLTGARADVQEMRELIGEMDQPKKPVRLSFFFLKGRGGETTFPAVAEERISELPEGLRPVGRSLQNGGFAQPRLLAPLTANAMENASFQTGGFISTGEHMAGLDIDVEGRVRQGTRAGTARIEIKAEVVRAARNPREEGGVARYPIFSVHTTLVAKFGDHVVLAAAPSSGEDGSDFLALVVRMDQGS